MIVGDDDDIDNGDVFDWTWGRRISLWPKPAERATTLAEDRITQNAKSRWKLQVIAGVTQPRSTQSFRSSIRQEFRPPYRHGMRLRVRHIGCTGESSSRSQSQRINQDAQSWSNTSSWPCLSPTPTSSSNYPLIVSRLSASNDRLAHGLQNDLPPSTWCRFWAASGGRLPAVAAETLHTVAIVLT